MKVKTKVLIMGAFILSFFTMASVVNHMGIEKAINGCIESDRIAQGG